MFENAILKAGTTVHTATENGLSSPSTIEADMEVKVVFLALNPGDFSIFSANGQEYYVKVEDDR